MEKRTQLKDEHFLQHPFLLLFALAMGFVIMDPFHTSPVGGHEFRPVKHDIAPYKQVMENWPRDNMSRLGLGNLEFVDQVFGPESLEFDIQGCGPYTGLADGRVVRWMGEDGGWEIFALVTKNWSEKLCAKGVDSTTSKQWKMLTTASWSWGLREASLHLWQLMWKGSPYSLQMTLTFHNNGSIFFTDTSKRYNRVNHFLIMLEGEATGRLLRYDPPTRTTHVVSDGLAFPNGVQLSKDQTFLLFTETTNCRLMKYWLEGPKRGLVELVANLPGFPDNVRLNEKGEFWVAIDCCRTPAQEVLTHNPWIRSVYFRLPIRMRYLARFMGMRMYTVVSLFNEKGEVLDVLEDKQGKVMKLVSEVTEAKGKLWIGTVAHNHIATLPYPLK
ncbi:calcium-dependent phosphotriesterase superfamily protein [Actinidia rufa]|uniref:Calcium-dependent phosphotriesterase superfamily protein n=1 Tax=Actinidia rufa TaxID=165716 RepID=A0A7J0E841_9ERIC|nr:calcium-dependent phosphotriesterase superfamily protein [Actinidia rufa]